MSDLYDLARDLDEALSNFDAEARAWARNPRASETDAIEFREAAIQGVEKVRDALRWMVIRQELKS